MRTTVDPKQQAEQASMQLKAQGKEATVQPKVPLEHSAVQPKESAKQPTVQMKAQFQICYNYFPHCWVACTL